MSSKLDRYQRVGLAEFMNILYDSEAWDVYNGKAGVADNYIGVFVPEHGVIYPPASQFVDVCENNAFLKVVDTKGNNIGLLDTNSKILWRLHNNTQNKIGTTDYFERLNTELDRIPIKYLELPMLLSLMLQIHC